MSQDPFDQYKNKPSHFLRGESEETSLERINARLEGQAKRNPVMPLLRWISIAAAAVLLLFVGKVFVFPSSADGMAQAFFEPFPNYANPTLRGQNDLNDPYTHYDRGVFDKAAQAFNGTQMSSVDSLYYGIALCGDGQWEDAQNVLSSISQLQGEYTPARNWYLSLALIEAGSKAEAQELLLELSAGNSSFSSNAEELLRALR